MDYLGIFAFDTASEFKFPINWTILFLYCWLFTKNHQKLPVRAGTAQEQLMRSSTQKATRSFYRQNTPASVSGQNTKALSSRTRKIPKSTQSPSLPVITPLHQQLRQHLAFFVHCGRKCWSAWGTAEETSRKSTFLLPHKSMQLYVWHKKGREPKTTSASAGDTT